MTIEMTGYACTTDEHGDSNEAWRRGCRHPGAVEAHERYKAGNRARDLALPPAVDEDGNCTADKHGPSDRAYRRGCRCAATVAAHEANDRRRASLHRRKRDRDYSAWYDLEFARVRRRTGGRLTADPRRPWRFGKMAVSRTSLWFLVHGFCTGDVTMGERLAAVAILGAVVVEDEAWYRRGHLMTGADIARRIGCSEQVAGRLNARRAELRAGRHLRRMADVRWKAAVVPAATGRADRERERHALARADREERQLRYTLRRYARERAARARRRAVDQ